MPTIPSGPPAAQTSQLSPLPGKAMQVGGAPVWLPGPGQVVSSSIQVAQSSSEKGALSTLRLFKWKDQVSEGHAPPAADAAMLSR
jgi:hypothetical protein